MSPKISVIIPIYNTASALDKCLKSLQDQTYSDIEVILINDGSKDDSERICKRFEQEDKRFIYVYQDNAGVSAARNNGICNARGEFFTFVDSDDWVEHDYCEKLLDNIEKENSDIAFCGINYWYDGAKHPQDERAFSDIVGGRRVEHFLPGHRQYVLGSSCRALFRTERYGNHRFSEDLHIYEDLTFLLNAAYDARKMSFISDCLYNYELSEANYFKKYDRDNFFDICYKIGETLYEILMRFGYEDWAKAELFKEYCFATDWIYVAATDKKRMFAKLKSHIITKEFCVKANYKQYKKLYMVNGFKAKIKFMLLYGKHYKLLTKFRNMRDKKPK